MQESKQNMSDLGDGPIHMGLATHLRKQILGGRISANTRIGPESKLCRRFGISRGPVRQAMDSLVREQLVYRIPGKGTFVRDRLDVSVSPKVTKSICVIVEGAESLLGVPAFGEIVSSIKSVPALEESGCRLFYEFHTFSGDWVSQADMFDRDDADGFIFVPLTPRGIEFAANLKPGRRPVVSFYRQISSSFMSHFYIDHEQSMVNAVEFLIRYGHERIGIVVGWSEYGQRAVEKRMSGYRRALLRESLPFQPELVVTTRSGPQAIGDTVKLLQSSHKPSALLIGGHGLINPCITAIHKAGLKVPDDLSVIAFDDSDEAMHHDPTLTVVKQPIAQGARLAVEKLLAHIANPKEKSVTRGLCSELIVRSSCAVRQKPAVCDETSDTQYETEPSAIAEI